MSTTVQSTRTVSRSQRLVQSMKPAMRNRSNSRRNNSNPSSSTSSLSSAGSLSPRVVPKKSSINQRKAQPQPVLRVLTRNTTSTSTNTTPMIVTQALPNRRHLPAPRTITPPSSTNGNSSSNSSGGGPSWEDYDEGVYAATRKKQQRQQQRQKLSSSSASLGQRSVMSTSFVEVDEDMPMDERMDSLKTASNKSIEAVTTRGAGESDDRKKNAGLGNLLAALQQNTPPTNLVGEEKAVLDLVHKTLAGAQRDYQTKRRTLERKFQETSTREAELDMQLSELQTQMAQYQQQERHSTSSTKQTTSSLSSPSPKQISQLQEQLKQTNEALKTKESEHFSEVRAIQRVLAEMHSERETESEEQQNRITSLEAQLEQFSNEKGEQVLRSVGSTTPTPSSPNQDEEVAKLQKALKDMETDKAGLKRNFDQKSRRLTQIERENKVNKTQLKKLENAAKNNDNTKNKNKIIASKELGALKVEMAKMKQTNEKLSSELSEAKQLHAQTIKVNKRNTRAMTPPRPEGGAADSESVSSGVSAEEVEGLHKDLSEKASSLENAKKIIASLENANGSMAVDLRAQVKAKEEELSAVQAESTDRKRRLDSLATELRDLQRKQGDVDRVERQTKAFVMRHKALMIQLENSISGLQVASVVHEISSSSTGQPDAANVEQISLILSETMTAVRMTVEMSEQFVDEYDDTSNVFTEIGDGVSSEVGRHLDSLIRNDREAAAQDLRSELDHKKNAVRHLEDSLKKQNEEMKRLRSELDKRSSGDTDHFKAEIHSLREQCSTNMEVLAKKERELSVLRSSLKVDENDAGYISDDASDGEDEDEGRGVDMSPARLNGYNPAETEALATILAAGGGAGGLRSRDMEALKSELLMAHLEKEKGVKDLQAERESLANAKMIISSLEQANKSMMEDLRSRLQDSNTAIASLLDKSMEHEKCSNSLREEVEMLKQEKDAVDMQHQTQNKKFKDEAKVYSLRVAAKDRELSELRKGSCLVKLSSEEKKEEGEVPKMSSI